MPASDAPRLGGEPLAAARATGCEDLASTLGGETSAKAVTTLADELGGLISAFHGSASVARPNAVARVGRVSDALQTRKTRPGTSCPGRDRAPEGGAELAALM